MSERRANPLLDLVWDLEAGRLNKREAVEELVRLAAGKEDHRALVDECIDLGVLVEEQRDATMGLLQSAPEETIRLLEGMGLSEAREFAAYFGWDTPARALPTAKTDEDREYEAWVREAALMPAPKPESPPLTGGSGPIKTLPSPRPGRPKQ